MVSPKEKTIWLAVVPMRIFSVSDGMVSTSWKTVPGMMSENSGVEDSAAV